ncbi:MAG: DUF922 domain-containing protein [Candidatus Nitrosocosmicus sp.]|nr:DUF922 domain-containing protein [Candidatus Nitrosocosmicus sp.]
MKKYIQFIISSLLILGILNVLVNTDKASVVQISLASQSLQMDLGDVLSEIGDLSSRFLPDKFQVEKKLPESSKEYPNREMSMTFKNSDSREKISASADAPPCHVDICVNPGESFGFVIECSGEDPRMVVTCHMVSGPDGATFKSTNGNPVEGEFFWSNPVSGTYKVILETLLIECPLDINCSRETPSLTITIFVNHPPKSNAGPSQTVQEHETVTLQGSGSDEDNDPLTYSWTQIGSPSVLLDSNSIKTPKFDAPQITDGNSARSEEMKLTFQLVTNDGKLDSEPSKTEVIIKPNENSKNCINKNIETIYKKEEIRPYFIGEKKPKQLHDAIPYFKIDPRDGKKVGSLTTWDWKTSPVPYSLDKNGRLDCNNRFVVTPFIDKPMWPEVKYLSKDAQLEWKRFVQASMFHEQGHLLILHNGYNTVGGFDGITNKVVGTTVGQAEHIIRQTVHDTQTASDKYDQDTLHGATQGALLSNKR